MSGAHLTFSYLPPYDHQALLKFLAQRAVPGLELCPDQDFQFARVVRFTADQQSHLGWVALRFEPSAHQVHVMHSETLRPVLLQLMQQVRWALDLEADPAAIEPVLAKDFSHCAGWRVPGTWDGFELAVRAILGQQITVKAARTLGQRLVNALGAPCETPWLELNRTFPSAATLALEENAAVMGSLGVVRQRQKAIQGLARAVESGALQLHAQAPLDPTLQALLALPGIGPWTAHYIAMRALRWLDAWPVQDVALQTALGVRQHPSPAQAVAQLGLAWQPYRSYALIAAWQRLSASEEIDHEHH